MLEMLFAIVGSTGVLINAVFCTIPSYRTAPAFLIPLIWLPYWLRKRLDLRPGHYAMFVAAVLLHDLGAYGFYQQSPLPFSFDILVHFYFAFAVVFMLHQALQSHLNLSPLQIKVAAFMCMMTLGALHEIMEYMTYLLLGEKNGMLKPSTSYFFDTQRDLTNNLLGTLLALTVITLTAWKAPARSPSPRVDQDDAEEEPYPAR